MFKKNLKIWLSFVVSIGVLVLLAVWVNKLNDIVWMGAIAASLLILFTKVLAINILVTPILIFINTRSEDKKKARAGNIATIGSFFISLIICIIFGFSIFLEIIKNFC